MNPVTCIRCNKVKQPKNQCFSEGTGYKEHEWGEEKCSCPKDKDGIGWHTEKCCKECTASKKVDQPPSEDWVEAVKDLYGFNNDNVLNVNTLIPFIRQLLLSERQKWESEKKEESSRRGYEYQESTE